MTSTRTALMVLANLTITAGYVFVAFRIVPRASVRLPRTKFGGIFFFALCGLTHLDMAIHTMLGHGMTDADMISWHMMLIHIPQAVAVWAFVTGLYIEFVQWGPWGDEHSLRDQDDLF